MINVGICFGGKSVEHDISIITYIQVLNGTGHISMVQTGMTKVEKIQYLNFTEKNGIKTLTQKMEILII